MNADTIIDLLVNRELLSPEQGEYYVGETRQNRTNIVDVLESHELITRDGLFNLIAEDIGGVYYDLSGLDPPRRCWPPFRQHGPPASSPADPVRRNLALHRPGGSARSQHG